MSAISPVTSDDLLSVVRWLEATIDHVRSLTACQRHDGALASAYGVRKIVRLMREMGPVHGFFSEVFFADVFAKADVLLAEYDIEP